MYRHILNLKKKVSPVVIERVIFKKESLMSRIFRISFSILVVFTIVWGVSKAEEVLDEVFPAEVEPTVSFSLAGIVKEVTSDKIILTKAVGVESDTNVFEIDIASNEQVIETNTYESLTIADILAEDKIIVQGFKRDGVFYSRRIISFAPRFPDTVGINGVIEPEIADEEILEIVTATSTEELPVDLATTTVDMASSTEETLSEESASSTISENLTDSAATTESESTESPADIDVDTTSEATDENTGEDENQADSPQTENNEQSAAVVEGENASTESIVEDSALSDTSNTESDVETTGDSSTESVSDAPAPSEGDTSSDSSSAAE